MLLLRYETGEKNGRVLSGVICKKKIEKRMHIDIYYNRLVRTFDIFSQIRTLTFNLVWTLKNVLRQKECLFARNILNFRADEFYILKLGSTRTNKLKEFTRDKN